MRLFVLSIVFLTGCGMSDYGIKVQPAFGNRVEYQLGNWFRFWADKSHGSVYLLSGKEEYESMIEDVRMEVSAAVKGGVDYRDAEEVPSLPGIGIVFDRYDDSGLLTESNYYWQDVVGNYYMAVVVVDECSYDRGEIEKFLMGVSSVHQ